MNKNDIYNINIPADPKAIRITRQGGHFYSDKFPAMGDNMFKPTGYPIWQDRGNDELDPDATMHGYITNTPLTIDKTNRSVFESLKNITG